MIEGDSDVVNAVKDYNQKFECETET